MDYGVNLGSSKVRASMQMSKSRWMQGHSPCVSVLLPIALINYHIKGNFREEDYIWGHSSRVESTMEEEAMFEAANHIAPSGVAGSSCHSAPFPLCYGMMPPIVGRSSYFS